MATFVRPPLDFEQYKEQWAKYELADNSILKVKVILLKVKRADGGQPQGTAEGKSTHSVNFQFLSVILTNERGTPDKTTRTRDQVKAAIVKDDMRFRTVEQDWNEYVTDDNTRIKIQPMLMKAAKTNLFNGEGEPIYDFELTATVRILPPTAALPAPP